MKENTKKIARLSYVIIFVLISVFTFILPRHDRSFFGNFSNDFLGDTIFTVAYFKVCKDPYGLSCNPIFQEAVGAIREVNVNGVTVSAEDYRRRNYLKFLTNTTGWRKKLKALNDWNDQKS